jgi:hypothetical protein
LQLSFQAASSETFGYTLVYEEGNGIMKMERRKTRRKSKNGINNKNDMKPKTFT